MQNRFLKLLACWAIGVGFPADAIACPFCAGRAVTLSEQIASSDAAVVAIRLSEGTTKALESTTFRVEHVVKGPPSITPQQRITLSSNPLGTPDTRFLTLGTAKEKWVWIARIPVNEELLDYLRKVPARDSPTNVRLRYFLGYLQHQNLSIAEDAYCELANAEYADIAELAQVLPRDKLRAWIADPALPATRIGMYAMLLGLCGNSDDAEYLAQKIRRRRRDEFRIGGDGVIAGYLLLTGPRSLELIESSILINKSATVRDLLAAMQALRFMWTYAPGRIERSRLRQAMRLVLDRPQVAESAIADLARWQDWEVQGQLMKMYEHEGPSSRSIRIAIVRFLLAEIAITPLNQNGSRATHVMEAETHLKRIRERDPELVAEAVSLNSPVP